MRNPNIDFSLDIDFTTTLRHNRTLFCDLAGEPYHLDTNDLDKQDQAHLSLAEEWNCSIDSSIIES